MARLNAKEDYARNLNEFGEILREGKRFLTFREEFLICKVINSPMRGGKSIGHSANSDKRIGVSAADRPKPIIKWYETIDRSRHSLTSPHRHD